ncbi:MAG TPA: Ig-like domain-containing protein, partial [Gemmatimonadaceae bacterium]|nr:Ig-like domain-containing protein [Gemmatimonadaceae bacterium]
MSFRAFGRGAETDLTNSVTDASGRASVKWLLGTNAAETQELSIWVWSKRSEPTLIALHARALPAAPARVAFEVDSLVFPLGATANVGARAWDAFNNEIDRGAIRFDVLDTALVFISSRGTAYPLHRGRTRIMASIGKAADTLPVTVYQRVDRLGVAGDSIVLLALGAIAPLTVTIADERGLPVRDTVPVISITDTAIVALEGESAPTMRARANGRTMVRLALGAVKSDVPVIVNQRPTSVSIVTYRRTLTAIGDTLRLRAELLDSLGSPISGRTPAYSSSDSSVVRVTQTGLLTALAEGRAVVTSASAEAADTVTIAVEPLPAMLEYETSTIELLAIGSRASSRAIVRDRLGTVIQRVRPRFQSSRPLVATVDTAGTIMSAGNGVAQVVATLDSLADTLTVTVAQRARYLEFTSDTIVLDALQQTRTIGAIAFDENGYRVPGAPSSVVIEDTSIARVRAGGELLSIQNGTTRASFTLAGLAASVPVVVEQRPSTIRIENTEIGTEIFLAPLHTALPIRCTAFDRNGFQVAARLVAVPRANSVYEGGTT